MINGKLDALKDVAPIYSGHVLRADAAASWMRLTGDYGRQIRVTDAYRSYVTQERIFKQRYTPQKSGGGYYGDVRFWNGVRYVRKPGTAAAAVPGTSNHGWGVALDLADGVNTGAGPAWEWLQANAARYGWVNPAWAKNPRTYEPWHWEYSPDLDQSKPVAGKGQLQIAEPEPELELESEIPTMLVIFANGGNYALISGGRVKKISLSAFNNLKAAGFTPVKFTNTEFSSFIKDWA